MAKKKDGPAFIKPNTSTLLPFKEYDQAIVSFSGGKDSLACVLHLLEQGMPPEKIELWHQAVDGRPGVAERFFDWPITEAYCNAAAEVLGLPIRYQWREAGFLGEMLKGELATEGPFALHSSVITAYFKVDEDGAVWATRNHFNATLFDVVEDADAWLASLPAEGTPVDQFFTESDLASVGKQLKKRQDKVTADKGLTSKQRAKKMEQVDAWYAKRVGPLPMPPLDRVQVTTPRPTAMIGFELYPGGLAEGAVGSASGEGDPGVRLQFPNPVADLRTRWCSSNLKIDVANIAMRNDPTYDAGKFLFITGERRQESENRAHYATIEKHKASTKSRRVDHWRAVIDWDEQQVWDIVARHGIRPHPGYYLAWGRLSCLSCIFGDPNQWASIKQIAPDLFNRILDYEHRFGKTVQEAGDVEYLASKGESFVPDDPLLVDLAMGEVLGPEYVRLAEGEDWVMPAGAFKRTGGPL